MVVRTAASRALAAGTVFTSAVRAHRYRVTAVGADRVVVGRLDANAPATLTRGGVDAALDTIRRASGRVARGTLFSTVAQEAALVALHPALRWDPSGNAIELVAPAPTVPSEGPDASDAPTARHPEPPAVADITRTLRLYEA